jgi:hypothetical protein
MPDSLWTAYQEDDEFSEGRIVLSLLQGSTAPVKSAEHPLAHEWLLQHHLYALAPELLGRSAAKVDGRADIYSCMSAWPLPKICS